MSQVIQYHSILSCIRSHDNPEPWQWRKWDTDEDKRIVRESLVKLLAVPENIRCCEPDDYDGEHPENFPPPSGMVMVKR